MVLGNSSGFVVARFRTNASSRALASDRHIIRRKPDENPHMTNLGGMRCMVVDSGYVLLSIWASIPEGRQSIEQEEHIPEVALLDTLLLFRLSLRSAKAISHDHWSLQRLRRNPLHQARRESQRPSR